MNPRSERLDCGLRQSSPVGLTLATAAQHCEEIFLEDGQRVGRRDQAPAMPRGSGEGIDHDISCVLNRFDKEGEILRRSY